VIGRQAVSAARKAWHGLILATCVVANRSNERKINHKKRPNDLFQKIIKIRDLTDRQLDVFKPNFIHILAVRSPGSERARDDDARKTGELNDQRFLRFRKRDFRVETYGSGDDRLAELGQGDARHTAHDPNGEPAPTRRGALERRVPRPARTAVYRPTATFGN
jgi:hypothetical protein